MKAAFYIGNHSKDTIPVRLFCELTRWVQKGPLDIVTHCEAIHEEYTDGSVIIASSSLRDKGVRSKRAVLEPSNWIIVDVPIWSTERSILWFMQHDKEEYDLLGAWATVMFGSSTWNKQFCSKALASSVGIVSPEIFGPHHIAAIAISLGKDVTQEFFTSRK